MSMPSPFEMGRAIGGNVSGAIRGAQEKSALDRILEQSMASEDPNEQNAMISQILRNISPERQGPALQIIQNKQAQIRSAQQGQAFENQGLDPSLARLDPGVQKEFIKQRNEKQIKSEEGTQQVQSAFNRVEEILGSGATGFSLRALMPRGRQERAELDTLGEVFISHLIPLLNPKGTISQGRFNYIKGLAPSSTDTDATIKGKMAALKGIFKLPGEEKRIEKAENTVRMKDPSGVIRNIPKDKVDQARAAGGVVINE